MTVEQLEKIKWLNRAYYADKQLGALISQRCKLRELTQRITVSYEGKDKGGSASPKNSTEEALMKLADIEYSIDNKIKELAEVYVEINDVINTVSDSVSRAILTRRYLSFETMEQIAEGINYSVRDTKRKHKKALDEVVTLCHCLSP